MFFFNFGRGNCRVAPPPAVCGPLFTFAGKGSNGVCLALFINPFRFFLTGKCVMVNGVSKI